MNEETKALIKQAFLDGIAYCDSNTEISEYDGWSRVAPFKNGPTYEMTQHAANNYVENAEKEYQKGQNDE